MLINRNYRLLWLGQAISLIGDYVFDTTLVLWIAVILLNGNTLAPLATGGLLVLVSLSMIIAAPIAGVLVDRSRDKRGLMLRADLWRAGLIGLLTILAMLPDGALPTAVMLLAIGVIVVATTVMAQFFNPSRFVLIGDIVPADMRGRAAGYSQALSAAAIILGPPLAAPLLIGLGPQWALGINAVSFLVSYLLIRLVRVPVAAAAPAAKATPKQKLGKDFLDGMRQIAANRVLRALLVSAVVMMIGLGSLEALNVYFVQYDLHADPKTWFGFVGTAFGAGMLVGSLSGGFLGDRFSHAKVAGFGALALGILFVVYSRLTHVALGLVVMGLMSLALAISNTGSTPLILNNVDRDLLGRMMTTIQLANRVPELGTMMLASLLVSTVLKGQFATIYLAGGLITIVGSCYAIWALRGVRNAAAPAGGVAVEAEAGALH